MKIKWNWLTDVTSDPILWTEQISNYWFWMWKNTIDANVWIRNLPTWWWTWDVVWPSSSINNNVVFFDWTTWKLIKDSWLILSWTNTGDQDLSSYATKTWAETITNKTIESSTFQVTKWPYLYYVNTSTIYRANSDWSNPISLWVQSLNFAVSPDWLKIAYVKTSDNKIYIKNSYDNLDWVQVTDTHTTSNPICFSPDWLYIVYTSTSNYLYKVSSSATSTNWTAITSQTWYSPIYSPDWLWIYYANWWDLKIYKKDATDSSNGTAITDWLWTFTTWTYWMTVSPDWQYLVYTDDLLSQYLYKIDLEWTLPSDWIAITSQSSTYPNYSKDWLYIYYSTWASIYRKNAWDTNNGTDTTLDWNSFWHNSYLYDLQTNITEIDNRLIDTPTIEQAYEIWKTIIADRWWSHIAARTASTYAIPMSNACPITWVGTLYPWGTFHINSNILTTPTWYTRKFKLQVETFCNDVAPAINFTYWVHPVTRPWTSWWAWLCIYTIWSAASWSTVALNTPAADSSNTSVSWEFTLSDWYYVLWFVSSWTVATSAHTHITARLYTYLVKN